MVQKTKFFLSIITPRYFTFSTNFILLPFIFVAVKRLSSRFSLNLIATVFVSDIFNLCELHHLVKISIILSSWVSISALVLTLITHVRSSAYAINSAHTDATFSLKSFKTTSMHHTHAVGPIMTYLADILFPFFLCTLSFYFAQSFSCFYNNS